MDKSRKQVQLDLDVDPVRGRGVSERASGRAAVRWDGTAEAGQDGLALVCVSFCSLTLLTLLLPLPSPLLSFFLVSDLLLISRVYLIAPHATPPAFS